MSDKLFADCCLGAPGQHAAWAPCPLEATTVMNTEANVFAAHLLMPEELLAPYLAKHPGSMDDDNWIERIANKFKVPRGLVFFRLTVAA